MLIIAAVMLAGVAGLLIVHPVPGRTVRRRLRPAAQDPPVGVRSGRSRLLAGIGLLVTGLPALAAVGWGVPGFWLSLPVLIFGATALHLLRRARRRRRAWANRRRVAQACSVLAAQVRIGQVPLAALRSAAEDCPVLRPAVSDAELGGDVVQRWRDQAAAPGMAGLADLARAWQLSITTGAPMASALDDVAEALTEDEGLRLMIHSEAAGPRASGKIVAALPLVGLGLGYAIGGDPVRFLVSTGYGWACLILGSLLACIGVLWMERVADAAAAEG